MPGDIVETGTEESMETIDRIIDVLYSVDMPMIYSVTVKGLEIVIKIAIIYYMINR